MKTPKALMSAILAAALLVSAAAPAAADSVKTAQSKASVDTKASSADASTFSWDNATVYFLLIDRFKNGDTSNDNSYGRMKTVAGSDWATFHGGDFAGITQKIEEGYFNDLGVNAIWLTAPYEQLHGYILGGNFAHYSYHGYYVTDYTEADANYGTKEEFKKLVDTAHTHGIRIIMDIVMNHAGYNNMIDMNEYGYGTLLPGWEDVYKNGNLSQYHSYIDYTTNDWLSWWGPDWIRSGLPGYSEGGNDAYTSSLTGLPDFMTESTKQVGIPQFLQTKWTKEGTLSAKQSLYGTSNTVTGFISSWLTEWVKEFGVDGFRCDTAKHVELGSWKQLKDKGVAALKEWKKNNPDKALDDLDFWMTGECWDHNLGYGVDGYYTQGGFDSMINFETSGGGMFAKDLGGVYQHYADEINSKDNFNQLSYISSHDSTLARGDMYHLGSALLMLPGGVQIYYGDETNRPLATGGSFDGNGGAGHSLRSDMNWDSMDENILAHWQKVGTFRNHHVAVGAGANVSLTADSGVAFGRTYSKNGVTDKIAAVVDAGADSDITIDVSGVFEDGVTLVNTYDETTDTVTGGKVTFNSGAHGTILLEEGEADPVKVAVKGDSKFDTTTDLAVTLEGIDSATLTIDGIKKVTVKNGDKVTIGDAAYPGDTVVVTLDYTHPTKGAVTKTFKYTKNSDGVSSSRSDKAIIHVKTDLSGAAVYSWMGDGASAKKLAGEWPGTVLSEKDADGWYVMNLSDSTDAFNILINVGGDANKSKDITGLKGETWVVAPSTDKISTFTDKEAAYEAAGTPLPHSDFDDLKAVCKEIKLLDTAGYSEESYKAALAVVAEADKLIAQGKDNADAAAVTAAYTNVLAAKDALVKGDPIIVSDTDKPVDTESDKPVDTESDKPIDPVDTDSDKPIDPVDTDSDLPAPAPTGKGDINGDGKITLRDATLAQKHSVKLTTLTADQITAGDMNGDGAVTLLDAYAIQTQANIAYRK